MTHLELLADQAGTPLVAIVNETLARVYSQDRPIVGRRIRTGGADREIVGVMGVYGIIAHSVAERRREFGIRIALGSTAGSAIRAVTMSGILLVAVGSLAGGMLSIPATSLVRTFLWRVSTFDPITYLSVAVMLLVVAVAASLLPALTLLRLNPAETLKN